MFEGRDNLWSRLYGRGMTPWNAYLPTVDGDEALADYRRYLEAVSIEALTRALAEIEDRAAWSDMTEGAGERTARRAINALKDGRPFSMVRIGDGEGNILGAFGPDFRKARHFSARGILQMMFGTADFPVPEIEALRDAMAAAVQDADVVGVSDPVRIAGMRRVRETPDASPDVRGHMGSYESLLQTAVLLRDRDGSSPAAVTNHVHRYMLPHLPAVIGAAREVALIGPYDLRPEFAAAFGRDDLTVHLIPNQASNAPGQGAKWYPQPYGAMLDALRIAPGALFVVAAGILSKALCHRIKRGGGVAIDIGSAVDVWRGVPVRQYHDPGFIARHRLRPAYG